MKKVMLSLIAILLVVASYGQGQTYVHGYTKSNGTYVEGHYRTLPNFTRNDNWSTIGNTNPYTGVAGTKPRDNYYTNTPVYSAPAYTTPTYTPPAYTPRSTYTPPVSTPTYYYSSSGY